MHLREIDRTTAVLLMAKMLQNMEGPMQLALRSSNLPPAYSATHARGGGGAAAHAVAAAAAAYGAPPRSPPPDSAASLAAMQHAQRAESTTPLLQPRAPMDAGEMAAAARMSSGAADVSASKSLPVAMLSGLDAAQDV